MHTGPQIVAPRRRPSAGARLAFVVALLVPAVRFAAAAPREAIEQPWNVTSLADERGLRRRIVYDVAFEPDGTAWIGASDGLYRYDGYGWRVFTTADGLPSPHVRAVLWTRERQLWVGTLKGAGVFDGVRFVDRGCVAAGGPTSIKKMAQDPDGTVWVWGDLYPSALEPGGIASYKDGRWRAYHVADGLPVDKVRSYLRDRTGRQFVTTGAGVSERVGDRWRSVPLPPDVSEPWALADTDEGIVGFGRNDGVYRLIGDRFTFERRATPVSAVNMVLRTRDGATLVHGSLDTQLVLWAWNGETLVRASPVLSRQSPWIQAVREAPDGSVWVLGDWGLLVRWQRRGGQWTGYEGLPAPAYLDEAGRPVFSGDFRHMLWKPVPGTYRYDDGVFAPLPSAAPPGQADHLGRVWRLRGDHVVAQDARGRELTDAPVASLGFARATHALLDGDRRVWIVGADARDRIVVSHDGATASVVTTDRRRAIVARTGPGAGVFVLATDGRHDLELLAVSPAAVERHPIAAKHDPDVKNHFVGLLVDPQNVAWVYGGNEATFLFDVTFGRDGEPARRIDHGAARITAAIAVPGATWFTKEPMQGGTDGLLVFRRGRWQDFETPLWGSGSAGFADRLVFRDRDRLLLVAGRDEDPRPLSMLPGREPPGSGEGVPLWDRDGNVWTVATDTTRGDSRVLRFRPDGVPPDTVIVDAPAEVRVDDRWRPRAIGIERFVPLALQRSFRFSFRIDGAHWSRFDALPPQGFSASALGIGSHLFEVRAEDEGGDVDRTPARMTFRITAIPIEQRPWFRPTVVALFAAMLALALVAIERARKAQRAKEALRTANDRLEVAVEARTAELRRANDSLARMHEEAKERIENELQLAERIQTTLLPRTPSAPGLDVACKMIPASEVGGDYYDLLQTDDGAWIGIGDVAGHGLPAGLIMLMVQSALASVVAIDPRVGPREALVAVNAVLCENIRRRMRRDEHVTLSLLRYHVDGRIDFSGAHEEIVVWRARERRCELVPTPGAWTGVSLKAAKGFEESRLDLAVGDVVVLYTDGVIEAEDARGEPFGIERLCDEVKLVADRNAAAMLDHLVAALRAWAHEQADDATFVVLRHTGEAVVAKQAAL